MTPESVGLSKSLLVLGKHSGRHAFEQHLKEIGYNDLQQTSINEAFKNFKNLADSKKIITDDDLKSLIDERYTFTRA